jgi:putative Mg2+ transporter-C (MgtC) family protein
MIELQPDLILSDLLRMSIAFALALPIGWERGRGARSVGFRTLPLVAMAACGFSLIAGADVGVQTDAQARIMQGVITGIGFIGGGAIVKNDDHVHGLATAASIWTAGAIGLAVGHGHSNVAVVLSLASILTLLVLGFLRPEEDEDD